MDLADAGTHLRAAAPPAPVRYDVALTLSDTELSVAGTVRVTLRNPTQAPLETLPLVLHPNATAGLIGAGPVVVDRLDVTPPGTWAVGHASEIAVQFAAPVAPGGEIVLDIGFHGALQPMRDDVNDLFAQGMAQMQMLNRSSGGGDFGLLASGDGITVAASPFPMVVPAIGGAFAHRVLRPDRPIGDLAWNAPAEFHARISTPAGLRVVTNGVDRPGPAEAGREVVLVDADHVSDLVVIGARDWVVAERDVGGVRVRSWARARDAAAGKAVLADGAEALSWLEGALGAYPFTELDLVEASLTGGAGGVEFGSLALIAGFMYRDPAGAKSPLSGMVPGLDLSGALGGAAGAMDDQRRFVVAHEVAHQWAPGLVAVDAWNHPVVDEPLAQYLAWRVVAHHHPEDAVAARDQLIRAGYGLHRLLGGDDGPADRATSGFSSSLEYAALVYGKAPGFYFALEDAVGRRTFDRALRAAVTERAWTAASPDDWLAALEAGGATGAVALGARWWREAHGDADLGLDPDGEVALRWMLGEATARQLEATLGPLGLSPAGLIRQLLGVGAATTPATPPSVLPGLDLEGLLRGLGR